MVSTYFFFYELSPKELCHNFNIAIVVDSIVNIGIYGHYISIKWHEPNKPIDDIAPIVRTFVDAIVSGYTLFAKPKIPLETQSTQWVELKGITITDNYVTGYMDNTFAILGFPDPTHEDNKPLKTIVSVFPLILNTPALRFAFNDYHMARRSRIEDTYVYLYRAIESIRKHFDGGSEPGDWEKMHVALKTSKSQIDPLTNESKNARHGNFMNMSIDPAKLNTCMTITEDVVNAFLYHLSDRKIGKAISTKKAFSS